MNLLRDITFASPWWFLLLLLLPLLIYWHWGPMRNQYTEIKMSSLAGVENVKSLKTWIRPFLNLLKMLAFVLLVMAMARPQNVLQEEKITTDGIDIVIATDISGSMLAMDFQPDRLEASKANAAAFIDNRSNDRIGLVAFAGESFTQCPITTDHDVLKSQLKELKSGLLEDGTAIGLGLATAVNRLKDSEVESKIIILLTDGENNKGFIDPLTAAETAKEFDIKVYTIGVGSRGMAPFPTRDVFGRPGRPRQMQVQLDETLLKEIAKLTGGKYYRATNNKNLTKIYAEIDELEKTEIETTSFKRYKELFYQFALWAGVLLLLDALLRFTLFRSIL